MSIPLRLFRLVKVEWRLFLLGLVLLGGGTIIQNYAPLEIQRVIDQVLTPVFNQGKELDRAAMLQHLGFYVGLIASASIIGYFASIILMSCANRIVEYIRNKAFDVMQNLPAHILMISQPARFPLALLMTRRPLEATSTVVSCLKPFLIWLR